VCGISGVFFNNIKDFKKNFNLLKKINYNLNHRGPDDNGLYINKKKKIILAHNRLSILDLSKNGHQPMISSNNSKILSYNGEIYNHIEIREYLKRKNYKINWKGSSDTETLLECIDKIGINKTLNKIYGMFSFAIWDNKLNCLYLSRDRMGEKPLYYTIDDNSFFFTSEIGQLNKIFNNKFEIDENSVHSFLNYNYIPGPNSVYKKVKKIIPGSYLKISFLKNKIQKKQFFFWKINPIKQTNIISCNKKDKVYVDTFEKTINNVIKDFLISDVPLGVFLSGGLDSSLVASVANNLTTKKINTFSLGVKDNEDYNELKDSEKIANYLKSNHVSFQISEEDIINNIERVLDVYDEPFADSSQVLTYILCKKAKKFIKVALTGDGGDEMFGGYNRYIYVYYFQKILKLFNIKSLDNYFVKKIIQNTTRLLNPNFISLFLSYGNDKYKKLQNISQYSDESNLYQLFISNNNELNISNLINNNSFKINAPNYFNRNNFLPKLIYSDLKSYLPDDLLVKVDRSSMSCGIESRSPLLDLRIYNYAKSLPYHLKFRNFKGKFITRELLKRYIPENIINSKKKGFSFSVSRILKNKKFLNWANKFISPKMIIKNRYINSEFANGIIKDHLSGKKNYTNTIWAIIVLQNWLYKKNLLS